jgi:hypothetical protein
MLSAAPEFIWELGLGIYLIVKGFRAPTTALHASSAAAVASR